jgi:uncharacterized protein YaeQ
MALKASLSPLSKAKIAMALNSTMMRFRITLSDTNRNVYEEIELRVPMHPSESPPFFLTRILAYCLNFQEGLEFSQGISSPDEPALQVKDLTGILKLWIDVGNPTAKRLHKASKAAEKVRVYTYRDPAILKKEMQDGEIRHKDKIEVFSLTPAFLVELCAFLDRDNNWEFLHTEGEISITSKNQSVHGDLTLHSLD